MLDSKTMALKAAAILDKKGANDIIVLDVAHMTSITDMFVICSGRNIQAVRALADDLEDKFMEEGIEVRRKEGERESKWIVLDYANVIVHIFHPEERNFYNIERLWQDGENQVEFIPLDAMPNAGK